MAEVKGEMVAKARQGTQEAEQRTCETDEAATAKEDLIGRRASELAPN